MFNPAIQYLYCDLHRPVIQGLAGSPYEGGLFKLDINIPARFPFEPPCIQFVTPIYHPNIDNHGRICLDILKMPPKGTWKPSIHLSGVLNSIRLLLQEPNPDDPLLEDIAGEFKSSYETYYRKARAFTQLHAVAGNSHQTPASTSLSDQTSHSSLSEKTKVSESKPDTQNED
eukprot:jgi/Hompol1/6129/HPOL_001612-RA